MRARLPCLLASILAALLLAACGGDTEPSANQLAYVDSDGDISLVNADGSGARKLGDPGQCGHYPRLIWSPTGHRLACVGSGTDDEGFIALIDAEGESIADLELPGAVHLFYWSPSGEAFLYDVEEEYGYEQPLFLADESGRPLADLGPVDLRVAHKARVYSGFALWSPDGDKLAYRPADAAEMRIYSLDSASEQPVPGDYHPLAWALDGKALLIAVGYEPSVGVGYPDYEASLFDLATQEFTRVPELDDGRQLWLSPDGMSAAVLTRRADGLPGLAFLHLQSGQLTQIPDSLITYGSESIPGSRLAFSADGSQLYWLTDAGRGIAIYSANSDGTGLTKLAALETSGAQLSSDLTMIAYALRGNAALVLYTAGIDGTGALEIASAPTGTEGFASAWRPAP